jgi:hypothetical protein
MFFKLLPLALFRYSDKGVVMGQTYCLTGKTRDAYRTLVGMPLRRLRIWGNIKVDHRDELWVRDELN